MQLLILFLVTRTPQPDGLTLPISSCGKHLTERTPYPAPIASAWRRRPTRMLLHLVLHSAQIEIRLFTAGRATAKHNLRAALHSTRPQRKEADGRRCERTDWLVRIRDARRGIAFCVSPPPCNRLRAPMRKPQLHHEQSLSPAQSVPGGLPSLSPYVHVSSFSFHQTRLPVAPADSACRLGVSLPSMSS